MVILPASGLAIWHVDRKGKNNHEQMTPALHYEASLEQADGQFHLETTNNNVGDAGDLYHAGTSTEFGAHTTPNSNWWGGTPSRLEIRNISAAGDTMTFEVV